MRHADRFGSYPSGLVRRAKLGGMAAPPPTLQLFGRGHDAHGLVPVVLQRLADPLSNTFLLRFGVVMSTLLLG